MRISASGKKTIRRITDYLYFIFGGAVYSFGFCYFIENNGISPGGVTGVAAIINFLTGFPTGFVYLLINLPILILGFYKIGGKFIVKTTFATVVISVFMEVFTNLLPKFAGERLIAAIFGGGVSGFGIAIVMLRGATTGGVDIIAKVLRYKYPYISMGRLILILDGVVAVSASICYRDVQTLLYTAVSLFASSKVMDAVLYGGDKGRLLLIITSMDKEISTAFFKNVHRGVTKLQAVGAYSGKENFVLLCALREQEVAKAVRTVKSIDPEAFTIITMTGGVLGSGFENRSQDST